MATYWVPDLPNIECFSGHLWRFIFIFGYGAPLCMIRQAHRYVSSSFLCYVLRAQNYYKLKSSGWQLEKSELPWKQLLLLLLLILLL